MQPEIKDDAFLAQTLSIPVAAALGRSHWVSVDW